MISTVSRQVLNKLFTHGSLWLARLSSPGHNLVSASLASEKRWNLAMASWILYCLVLHVNNFFIYLNVSPLMFYWESLQTYRKVARMSQWILWHALPSSKIVNLLPYLLYLNQDIFGEPFAKKLLASWCFTSKYFIMNFLGTGCSAP